MREDYLGRLAKYQSQVPRLLETVYRLQELTREAATEAIIKPAQKCQLKVSRSKSHEIMRFSGDVIEFSNIKWRSLILNSITLNADTKGSLFNKVIA